MILFPDRDGAGWPDQLADDRDPQRRYAAPTSVGLRTQPDGAPDLQLVRYTASARDGRGGALSAVFALRWSTASPDHASTDRAWPVLTRFRLRWRGPASADAPQTGAWRNATLLDDGALRCVAELSEEEAAAAEALARDDDRLLDLDVELGLRGKVPALDWQVEANTAGVHRSLRARLGTSEHPRDTVDAAVMSLPEGAEIGVTWRPTRSRAAPASPTTLLAELAVRLRDDLFERVGDLWRLRDIPSDTPSTLVYNLSLPRSEVRTRALSWSFDQAWREASDAHRDRLLTTEARMELVQRADVHVVNQLPIDPRQLLLLDAKVRFPAGQGQWQTHRVQFPAGATQLRIPAVKQLGVPFVVSYDAAVVLAPLGGPMPRPWPPPERRQFRPVHGTVVTLGPLDLDVRFVLCSAEPALFELADRVQVLLRGADGALLGAGTLDAAHPSTSLPLPGVAPRAPLHLEATAFRDAPPATLTFRRGPLGDGPTHLAASELRDAPTAEFTFVAPAALPTTHAWAAVEFDDGTVSTLDPGRPTQRAVQPPDRFTEPTCTYRTLALPWLTADTTAPLVTGPWQQAAPGTTEVAP